MKNTILSRYDEDDDLDRDRADEYLEYALEGISEDLPTLAKEVSLLVSNISIAADDRGYYEAKRISEDLEDLADDIESAANQASNGLKKLRGLLKRLN